MSSLEKWIDPLKGKRVVVLADLVADIFLHGEIARISREAPVLILNQRDKRYVPGGGANAIHNIWSLGGIPHPVGIVGEDTEGDHLVKHFASLGIDTSDIEKAPGYQTPTKMRILAGMPHGYLQQVVRVDWGSALPHPSLIKKMRARLKTALKQADAFLISDYGYGLITPEGVLAIGPVPLPTFLDSRFSFHRFSGITASTPNESEVEAALGFSIGGSMETLNRAGQMMRKRLKQDALLITRGKDGMALFERGKKPVHIPVYGADEVTDVTGAGDTVIATFTLARSAGASFVEAAQLANVAGGIVVMKRGTATVSANELRAAVRSLPD